METPYKVCDATRTSHLLLNHWAVIVPKLFGFAKIFVFAFSAPPSQVGETLHVAYNKYKIKRILIFWLNTIYISSQELKMSKLSLVLCIVKIPMFSTHSMKYIWYSAKKSKYPLFITWRCVWEWNNAMQ